MAAGWCEVTRLLLIPADVALAWRNTNYANPNDKAEIALMRAIDEAPAIAVGPDRWTEPLEPGMFASQLACAPRPDGTATAAVEMDDIDYYRHPLFAEARSIVVRTNTTTVQGLQRALRIGFGEAMCLLDQLEAAGVVGPWRAGTGRDLRLTETQLDELIRREHL